MAQTHTDTNVNQLVINKMTKQEYDNLPQVSDTELYLVEEQVDSVVTQNSTNPVQSGAVFTAIQDAKDVIMCKMSDGIVYDSYITYTKVKQYLPDYPYYSDDLDWEIGGNPPTRANITADNYYLDVDTKHIFVADENLELLDITSSVVIHGDINKLYCDVDTNILYRYDGSNFVLLNAKTNEIVDNFIITKDDTNHWYAYSLEGIYIGLVEGIEPPVFYDKATSSLHTFTSDDYNKYFYDYIDNKMYMCFRSGDSPTLNCISDVPLYNLENLDTTKTYISYGTNKIYRTNDGTEFKLIATNSYNDLSNKPLSVESNKVKYTLSDGTTKLTLAQENDIKDIGIDFTSSAVSGNIVSGETLSVMMKKINQLLGVGIINLSNVQNRVVYLSGIYGFKIGNIGIINFSSLEFNEVVSNEQPFLSMDVTPINSLIDGSLMNWGTNTSFNIYVQNGSPYIQSRGTLDTSLRLFGQFVFIIQ